MFVGNALFLLALPSQGSEPWSVLEGPPGTSVVNTPLAEILQRSAIVVEGSVIETREDIWLGPVSSGRILIWRVRVEEEILGHVESGVVDLVVSDEWPPTLKPGERVLMMANVMTLHAPTYERGRSPALEAFPAYDDLMVPTVTGTLYHFFTDIDAEGRTEQGWSSPVSQTGADWLPPNRDETNRLSWSEILQRVRDGAMNCVECGRLVPGVAMGSAP